MYVDMIQRTKPHFYLTNIINTQRLSKFQCHIDGRGGSTPQFFTAYDDKKQKDFIMCVRCDERRRKDRQQQSNILFETDERYAEHMHSFAHRGASMLISI